MASENNLGSVAKKLAVMGIVCLPLSRHDKHGHGKAPMPEKWQNFTVQKAIEFDWSKATNIGILTGPSSGIVCLDIDVEDSGFELFAEYERKFGKLVGRYPRQNTGRKGLHIFGKNDPRFKSRSKIIIDGVEHGLDMKAKGGQAVIEPSVNCVSGGKYEWVEGHSLFDYYKDESKPLHEQIDAFPESLIEFMVTRKYKRGPDGNLIPTAEAKRTRAKKNPQFPGEPATEKVSASIVVPSFSGETRTVDLQKEKKLINLRPPTIEQIEMILRYLSTERLMNYDEYISIIGSLFHATEHDESLNLKTRELVKDWIRVHYVGEYDPHWHDDKWNSLVRENAGSENAHFGSLIEKARIDSPGFDDEFEVNRKVIWGAYTDEELIELGIKPKRPAIMKYLTCNQFDHADAFVEFNKSDVVVKDKNECYIWDDAKKLWKQGDHISLIDKIGRYLLKMIAECEAANDKWKFGVPEAQFSLIEGKVQMVCWAGNVSRVVIARMRPLAEDIKFDNGGGNEHFLPIKGGRVVDLRTGEVRERRKTDYFTIECPVEIETDKDRNAIAKKFVLDICRGDEELMSYLQKCLGYMLTGDTSAQSYFIMHGRGANGKSALFDCMQAVLGGFYTQVSKTLMLSLKDSAGRATPELMTLEGKRCAIYTELNVSDTICDGMVKKLTGEKSTVGRKLYGEERELPLFAKLSFLTNHKPKVKMDFAMKRRTKFIPYKGHFASRDDPEFVPGVSYEKNVPLVNSMLTENLSAFATWLVEGAQRYYAEGIDKLPAIVAEELASYVEECNEYDTLQQFLDESGRVTRLPTDEVQATKLLAEYTLWCNGQHLKPMKSNEFYGKLTEKGYTKRKSHGVMVYTGLGLKSRDDL